MNNREYMSSLLVTEASDKLGIVHRMSTTRMIRLTHAAMGLASEVVELELWFSKLGDYVHTDFHIPEDLIAEAIAEVGDLWWFLGVALDEVGYSGIPHREMFSAMDREFAPICGKGSVKPVLIQELRFAIERLVTSVKAMLFYDRKVSDEDLVEILGEISICLYAISDDEMMPPVEDIWRANIAKLRARYSHLFSEYDANNRDTDAERAVVGCAVKGK